MARYIDADKLVDKLEELQFNAPVMTPVMKIYNVIELIEDQPTADVAEVVRCGKCKHWMYIGQGLNAGRIGKCCNDNFPFHCEQRPIMKEGNFCSYGVKKDATDTNIGNK